MTFQPLDFTRLDTEQQRRESARHYERMSRRRTVREFSPESVPLEIIDNAILAASRAPSGANQQPWRFVVVRDANLKRQIREAAEAEERENYEHRFPQEWLDELAQFGTDWQKPFLEIAPYLIIVFRIDYGLDPVGHKLKHYYVQESVGIATGFLLTALHLAGLATLTHTPSPMGFLTRILERPANERPFLLIPVGYPATDARVPVIPKKTLDEVRILK